MQSIDMEFAKNLLASFQELQRSHAALQKRMAEFESMAAAKFEAYEAELAKKDAVIASLRTTIARQEAELERYRDKDKTNSNNSHMSPSKDKTKAAKERAIAQGKKGISKSTIYRYMEKYDLWIWSGKQNTPPPKVSPKTGKKESKSYARRLVERLERYRDEVCLFFTNFTVPFDNNQAERDLRPEKTKMKVSGVMRPERGAEAYVIIRSFISTAKKHGTNIIVALRLAFSGRAREAVSGAC